MRLRRRRRSARRGPASPLGRSSWPRRLLHVVLTAAAVAVLGAAVLWLTLPDPAPLAADWPETTAYMDLRREEARDAGRPFELSWEPVPLSGVPDRVRRAMRVAEDAMFFQHRGVDWHEVRASVRAWWTDDDRLRGASTITMQLARNLYLSPDRSPWRKLREVLIALRLEDRLEKRRILELYLNVAELGPAVFGVEAAARHYWGTSVSLLGRRRAAELAATLPAPLADNPETRTRRFLWRAQLIRRRAFGGRPPEPDEAPSRERRPREPPLDGLPAPDSAARAPGGPHVVDAGRRVVDTAGRSVAAPEEADPRPPHAQTRFTDNGRSR